MEIKWTKELVNELRLIVSYLKKNKIGVFLENLGNYFIFKHSKRLNIKNYSMGFSEEIDPEQITDGEFNLAFICELINSFSDKNKTLTLTKNMKKVKKIKRPKGFINVFFSFSAMLKYCIGNNFHLNFSKLDYKVFYISNVIKEIIAPEKKNSDILTLPYFLTKELMKFDYKLLYNNTSLILKTEDLDLSILNRKQILEIMEVLETKKRIFVRILLVLSFEILREEDILNELWFHKNIIFTDYDEFKSVLSSPLIEVLIFLTSFQLDSLKIL
jgi:hypothetical protein